MWLRWTRVIQGGLGGGGGGGGGGGIVITPLPPPGGLESTLPQHLADTTHHSMENNPIFKKHPWFNKDGSNSSVSLSDAINGKYSPMDGMETVAEDVSPR